MAIPNNHQNENSEIRQESYTGTDGNTHTHVTRTTETVNNKTANPNSYQNGYLHGRSSERSYQQAHLAERDNDNAARGLLLGVILTSLVTLIASAFWYFNQRDNATVDNVENTTPVLVPVPSNNSPTPSASPQPETTIIERTTQVPVPVPVPQQQVSPPAASSTPNINITVPPQQPAAQPPAATQTTPRQTQSPTNSTGNTSIPGSNNDTSTNTATPRTNSDTSDTTSPQGVDQSSGTSNNDSSTTGDTSTGGSAQ